jgi:hypothetical protein
MIYPVVFELAADGVPVAVTCWVLEVFTSGYYEWAGREDFLPPDWLIGEVYSTTLTGDGLLIAPEDERRLQEIAREAGSPLTRNDPLVGYLDV